MPQLDCKSGKTWLEKQITLEVVTGCVTTGVMIVVSVVVVVVVSVGPEKFLHP
jgi:hypothetical protein